MGILFFILVGAGLVLVQENLTLNQVQSKSQEVPALIPTIAQNFAKVPIFFVPNQGQMDQQISFYINGADKTIYFAPDGVTFALSYSIKPQDKKEARSIFQYLDENHEKSRDKDLKRWIVKMDFVDARRDVKPEGVDKTNTVISYFKGKPEEWKAGLRAFSSIIYRDIWPGIDLVFMGEMGKLKYEFIVHPGAEPEEIKLKVRGAEKVGIDEEGGLNITTPAGSFKDEAPLAYQIVDGKREEVCITYEIQKDWISSGKESMDQDFEQSSCRYGFAVGDYNTSHDLVLDPAMPIYCGYIGGGNYDIGREIAVDTDGNAYITGWTESDENTFPEVVGPDLTFNGNADVFVAKVDAMGTHLDYCGYIGGSSSDAGYGIAVDKNSNAYVVGSTSSDESTFPVVLGPDLTFNGNVDVFVAKVDATGTHLDYCGFIGGEEADVPRGIAVDTDGNAYITGDTGSDENTFPVVLGPDLTFNEGSDERDAFVAKVDAMGTHLDYCGYIGGYNGELCDDVAVDKNSNAYVVGSTHSDESTFPVVAGPDLTFNGNVDVFVAKVDATGTHLDYCGYIGGLSFDAGYGISVDTEGNAYITGITDSDESTFPVVLGPDLTSNGFYDVFVAKVDATGTHLDYCGYIGGLSFDAGYGISVDTEGNAYITGETESDESTFPVVAGPDLTFNGRADVFVAKVVATGTHFDYCGYIGGLSYEYGYGVAVDKNSNAYVVGSTSSDESTFPVVLGPDLTFNGGYNEDAFVAKVIPLIDNDNDGIEDTIDSNPSAFSNDFSDVPLSPPGTTEGYILDRGSYVIRITDLPNPRGVWVQAIEGSGSPAKVSYYCDSIEWIAVFYYGASFGIKCGSASFEVRHGPIEIHLVTDSVVTIPDDTTAEMIKIDEGTISIKNSAGSGIITVLDKGTEILLNPGESTVVTGNTPPVAICKDIEIPADENCEASIIPGDVDGGSYDPDEDDITLSVDNTGPFSIGEHIVTLTVTDEYDALDSCQAIVTVVDVTPPVISISLSPNILWPPNHKMILITPTIAVSDNCDANPDVELTSITMNEGDETNAYDPDYDTTLGDGKTVNDIEVDESGNIYLRAERSARGNGRIYTITYTVTDASGNTATATATVTVPHDQ
jgi:hypothetical protein